MIQMMMIQAQMNPMMITLILYATYLKKNKKK